MLTGSLCTPGLGGLRLVGLALLLYQCFRHGEQVPVGLCVLWGPTASSWELWGGKGEARLTY